MDSNDKKLDQWRLLKTLLAFLIIYISLSSKNYLDFYYNSSGKYDIIMVDDASYNNIPVSSRPSTVLFKTGRGRNLFNPRRVKIYNGGIPVKFEYSDKNEFIRTQTLNPSKSGQEFMIANIYNENIYDQNKQKITQLPILHTNGDKYSASYKRFMFTLASINGGVSVVPNIIDDIPPSGSYMERFRREIKPIRVRDKLSMEETERIYNELKDLEGKIQDSYITTIKNSPDPHIFRVPGSPTETPEFVTSPGRPGYDKNMTPLAKDIITSSPGIKSAMTVSSSRGKQFFSPTRQPQKWQYFPELPGSDFKQIPSNKPLSIQPLIFKDPTLNYRIQNALGNNLYYTTYNSETQDERLGRDLSVLFADVPGMLDGKEEDLTEVIRLNEIGNEEDKVANTVRVVRKPGGNFISDGTTQIKIPKIEVIRSKKYMGKSAEKTQGNQGTNTCPLPQNILSKYGWWCDKNGRVVAKDSGGSQFTYNPNNTPKDPSKLAIYNKITDEFNKLGIKPNNSKKNRKNRKGKKIPSGGAGPTTSPIVFNPGTEMNPATFKHNNKLDKIRTDGTIYTLDTNNEYYWTYRDLAYWLTSIIFLIGWFNLYTQLIDKDTSIKRRIYLLILFALFAAIVIYLARNEYTIPPISVDKWMLLGFIMALIGLLTFQQKYERYRMYGIISMLIMLLSIMNMFSSRAFSPFGITSLLFFSAAIIVSWINSYRYTNKKTYL